MLKQLSKHFEDGHHGYTPATGILPLREAVSADIHKRINQTISPENVLIVPGGKVSMFLAILMFGEPGTEILYPDPGFPIYRSMIEYTGAKPIPIPIREENKFAFSADETISLLTDKTRLVIINSPANPTGGVTPKAEIEKLVAELEKRPDIAILSDEIYGQMTYDDHATCLVDFLSVNSGSVNCTRWLVKNICDDGVGGLDIQFGQDLLYDKARKLAVTKRMVLRECTNTIRWN